MGKFESLLKYLGNEEQHAPEKIEMALDELSDATPVMGGGQDAMSEGELSAESLANIDSLLGAISGPEPEPVNEDTSTALDLDQLDEIPVAPRGITEEESLSPEPPAEETPTEDFDLSGFGIEPVEQETPGAGEMDMSGFDMGGTEEPSFPTEETDLSQFDIEPVEQETPGTESEFDLSQFAGEEPSGGEEMTPGFAEETPELSEDELEDFSFAMETPEPTESAMETSSEEEDFSLATTPAPSQQRDFSQFASEKEQKEMSQLEEGLDPEILEELHSLDSPPPPKEDIYRKRESAGTSQDDDYVKMALEEEGPGEDDVFGGYDVEVEEPGGSREMGMEFEEPPDTQFGIQDESDMGEIQDLLSNLTPSGKETSAPPAKQTTIQDTGPQLEETSDLADLKDLLGQDSEMSLPSREQYETPVSEDLGTEPSGGFDFGLEPSEGEEAFGGLEQPVQTEELTFAPEEQASDFGDFGIEEPGEAGGGDMFGEAEPPTEGGEVPGGLDIDLGAFDEPAPEAGVGVGEDEFNIPSMDVPELDLGEAEEIQAPPTTVQRQTTPTRTPPPVRHHALPQLDIDEDKALKIRNRINQMTDPDLRKNLRRCFLEPVLPHDVLENLLALLLLHEDQAKVAQLVEPFFKEERAEVEAEERPEAMGPRPRRVLYAEDARKAKEFQKDVQNMAKYAGLVIAGLLVLAIITRQFVWRPAQAKRYYTKAMEALVKGDYKTSEANFEIGKSKGGYDLSWHNKFALAYLERDQDKLALNKFKDALSHNPYDLETVFNYSDYLDSLDPPRFKDSIEMLEFLQKKKKDDYKVVDKIGQVYVEWAVYTRNPEEAIKYFDEANSVYQNYLGKKNKHIPSYFRLLSIALKTKNQEAIDMFYDIVDGIDKKAIDVGVYVELGKYYVDNRQLSRAKLVFAKLMDYLNERTKYDKRKKKITIAAESAHQKMLFAEAYYQYARYLTVNMDFLKAITAASNAFMLNENNGYAYNLMGEIYYVSDNIPDHKELAKDLFNKAIRYSSDYYKPYANLGHIYYYDYLDFQNPEESLEAALRNYEKAREIQLKTGEKKDVLLQYNLAWLYYRYGKYDQAFDEWSNLYLDEPYNPVLSYAMGNTYYHMAFKEREKLEIAKSQYEKAIEYYQRLADKIAYINPELERHKEIYSQLARAYNNRGVIYAILAEMSAKDRPANQQKALLDFYSAKDSANKIQVTYPHAEYNIRYIINNRIQGREPSFDEEIPKRTTLQKLIQEFENNLIDTI